MTAPMVATGLVTVVGVLATGTGVTAATAGTAGATPRRHGPFFHADFDRDGYEDLAVGAPGEDVGSIADAGNVTVLFGGPGGIDGSRWQIVRQGAVAPGAAEAGDRFGFTVATQDFDHDGYDDLAVGAPGEDVGPIADAGNVTVLYGSRSGFDRRQTAVLRQGVMGIPGRPEAGDAFGASLSAGQLESFQSEVRHADLVVGAPGEDAGDIADAGNATVVEGTEHGLGAGDVYLLRQGDVHTPGRQEAGDRFGAAVHLGTIGHGRGQVLVGAPGEDLRGTVDAGEVMVFDSPWDGFVRPTAVNVNQRLIGFGLERGAEFGSSILTSSLIDGEGNDEGADIVVGAPGSDGFLPDAGAVFFIAGSGSIWLDYDRTVPLWGRQVGERLGTVVHTGWGMFNRDYVLVGSPLADVSGTLDAGQVLVLVSNGTSLTLTYTFTQEDWGGQSEPGDHFGERLSAGDYLHEGWDQFAVGVPSESVGGATGAGATGVSHWPGDYSVHRDGHVVDQTEGGGAAEPGDAFGTPG